MNVTDLRKKLALLILCALTLVILPNITNSSLREVYGSRDDRLENQIGPEINLNNTFRGEASDMESSEICQPETEANIQEDLRLLKSKLSVHVTLAKFAAGQFLVKIEGNNPNPSGFILSSVNSDVELSSGDYKVNMECQDDGKEPIE